MIFKITKFTGFFIFFIISGCVSDTNQSEPIYKTQSTLVKKTCSSLTPESCTKFSLCNSATRASGSSKIWAGQSHAQAYVKEAKFREFTCGVTKPKAKSLTLSLIDITGASFDDFSPNIILSSQPIFNIDKFESHHIQELKEGPNFNGKYRLLRYGCGSSCKTYSVVDLTNGLILRFQYGGEKHWQHDLVYDKNSSLIKIIYPETDYDLDVYNCIIEEVWHDGEYRSYSFIKRYIIPWDRDQHRFCEDTPDWIYVKKNFEGFQKNS